MGRTILAAALVVGGIQAVASAAPTPGDPLMVTGTASTAIYPSVADARAKVRVMSRTTLAGGTARLVWLGDQSKAKIGDVLKPVVLASAPVDGKGNYAFRFTPGTAELAALKGNDGWLNVTVEVTSPSGATGSWGTSRRWRGASWATPERPDMDASRAVAVDVPVDATGKAQGTPTGASGSTAALACLFRLTSIPERSTRIGLLHNASNGSLSWRYGRTADSDIEYGVKFLVGGQGVEGTSHVGTSRTTNVGGNLPSTFHQFMRTDFDFNHYTRQYLNLPNGTRCDDSGHTRIGDVMETPRRWTAGAQYDAGPGSGNLSCRDPRVRDPWLKILYGGTYMNTNNSRATKIGYAVNTGFLRLGQTSGYSTNVDIGWAAKYGTGGLYLCGRDGKAVDNPGVMYVWNRA